MPRILSGIQPSGRIHLGNYCGAVRQWVDLQELGHEQFIFVASYHALTTQRDAPAYRATIRQLATDLLAFGLDPARTALYLQHDVPEVAELAWLISCVCPMAWMEKMVGYKDKLAKGISPNVGLFNYPILQAADILSVDADLVPVGRDQVQHIEITRDLAARFNEEFQAPVFKLPAHRLVPEAEVLPGVDGEKMSKSYGNTIDPFEDENPLKKRVMSIKTDGKGLTDAKDPETCNVFRIFRAIAGKNDQRTIDLAVRYREPGPQGFGYGHAKLALLGLILDHFGPARRRRAELMADPAAVDAALRQGADRARAIVRRTTDRARAACGLA